jgi:hypothetical protein
LDNPNNKLLQECLASLLLLKQEDFSEMRVQELNPLQEALVLLLREEVSLVVVKLRLNNLDLDNLRPNHKEVAVFSVVNNLNKTLVALVKDLEVSNRLLLELVLSELKRNHQLVVVYSVKLLSLNSSNLAYLEPREQLELSKIQEALEEVAVHFLERNLLDNPILSLELLNNNKLNLVLVVLVLEASLEVHNRLHLNNQQVVVSSVDSKQMPQLEESLEAVLHRPLQPQVESLAADKHLPVKLQANQALVVDLANNHSSNKHLVLVLEGLSNNNSPNKIYMPTLLIRSTSKT